MSDARSREDVGLAGREVVRRFAARLSKKGLREDRARDALVEMADQLADEIGVHGAPALAEVREVLRNALFSSWEASLGRDAQGPVEIWENVERLFRRINDGPTLLMLVGMSLERYATRDGETLAARQRRFHAIEELDRWIQEALLPGLNPRF